MAINDQNTIAGTANGGSLISTVGNTVLGAFDKLTNVAWDGLETYGSFRERLMALGLIKQDKNAPPQQTTPATQVTSFSDYWSNPQNVADVAKMVAIASAAGVGLYFLVKKLK